MEERETERAAAEVATVDASAPRFRSGDEPILECGSSDSPDQAEPSAAPKESGWDSLRMRASALEAKLSGLKASAAELEAGLDKLRQDDGHHEVHARRESAAGR